MTDCELSHIPKRLHTEDKPIISIFVDGEFLYRRCNLSESENPYLKISLAELSHNRSGHLDNIISNRKDVLFNISLSEEYSEEIGNGAWMASPIHHTDNGLEVRPAGGNWCFKSRGAVPSILEPKKKKEVYESWIKHLEKTINFLSGKFPEVELDYKNKISFWQSLADACH